MKEQFFRLLKERKSTFLISLCLSVLLYSPMLVNQLTNTFDGFWRQNYSMASSWELSLGRWGLPVLDNLVSGLHIDPLNGILTLTLFILGLILILIILDINNKPISVLFILSVIMSTAISSIMGYRMTCLAYSMGFVLSVLAVLFIRADIKNSRSILISSLCICLFMGLYQNFLCIYVLVFLISIINNLLKEKGTFTEYRKIILKFITSSFSGLAAYYIILKINLFFFNTSLNSYHNANQFEIGQIIKNLPKSFGNSYSIAWNYYIGRTFRIYASESIVFQLIPLISILICIIVGILRTRQRWQALITMIICFLLLPPACSFALILVPSNSFSIHMSIGCEILIPLLLVIFYPYFGTKKILNSALIIICCILLLLGSSLQVLIDENAMNEGYQWVKTMGIEILDDLDDQELLSSNYSYRFIGKPSDNPLFYHTPAYENANTYAKVGNFALTGNCAPQNYIGMFNRLLGTDLKIDGADYESYSQFNPSISMPCYPQNGYIQRDSNIVYVKISE